MVNGWAGYFSNGISPNILSAWKNYDTTLIYNSIDIVYHDDDDEQ